LAETRTRHEHHKKRLVTGIALGLGFLACAGGCALLARQVIFPPQDLQADVKRLETMLPWLQKYELEVYMDRDWCKRITYRRGMFYEATAKDYADQCSTYIGGLVAIPFDTQAQQDFSLIGKALDTTGVDIYAVYAVKYDDHGTVEFAVFNMNCGLCRRHFVYKPDYFLLPQGYPGEVWYSTIDNDWYLEEEDWN